MESLLKVFGLSEEEVRGALGVLEGVEVDYIPAFPELHLRVVLRAGRVVGDEERLRGAEEVIAERLGIALFGKDGDVMEGVVGGLLRAHGGTIAVAESCTGGLITHRLTEIPGSSDYLLLGVVAYSNEAKRSILGVPAAILDRYGAVSRETAEAMAKGVRGLIGATIGVATTGVAGPGGGSPGAPVGRVYIAVATEEAAKVLRYDLSGDRQAIKLMASELALDMVRRHLLSS